MRRDLRGGKGGTEGGLSWRLGALLCLACPASQVIFSLTPIWGAVMAQLVLGDEQMGPVAWAGGAAVLLASLLAARAQSQSQGDGAAKAAH
jgi:hypothetical protein